MIQSNISYDWSSCPCADCEGVPSNLPPQKSISKHPTPYAIICSIHKQVFLSSHEYNRQMRSANSLWVCPLCPEFQIGTQFDDANYDKANEQLEQDIHDVLTFDGNK